MNASSDSVASALGALGSSVPASLRRRLAQSVSLGKRCVELEREARFAREAAGGKAKEVEALELRVRRAESKADDSSQPYNYLVERISAAELEADECRAREKAATETLARARAEATTARAEADALRADLQRALTRGASSQPSSPCSRARRASAQAGAPETPGRGNPSGREFAFINDERTTMYTTDVRDVHDSFLAPYITL